MKRALLGVLALAILPAISCKTKPVVSPKNDPDPVVTDEDPIKPTNTAPKSGGAGAGAGKATATPALLAQPLPNDTSKVTIHRLSNGMTVYIAPDPQEPTIVAHVAVKAGSANDPGASTGLAHYLEHMLFKGTSKLGTLDYAKEKPILDKIAALYADLRKPGIDRAKTLAAIDSETQKAAELAVPNELDQLYARMGVTGLNAYTNSDATVYVTEIPKNRLAQWAKVEVARYSDAVFRLFWPELEAVYEEKNRGMDNPPRRAYETFIASLFPKHGIGQLTIGEIEHLKSPAYADMVAFYNRYYTPQNMAILLAGDVDTSVLPLLEQEFGAWKRPPGEAPNPGTVEPLKGRVAKTVTVPSNPGVMLGWHLVPATHKDRDALELMDLLVLDGQYGILARDLLISQKVADASSNPTFLRDAGYYTLSADALDGQPAAELEKLLLGLVTKLQNGDFTDQDLATAILTAEIRQQQLLESNGGRMSLMEEAFIGSEEWTDMVGRIDRFKKITKADIQRVAKQYLGTNYLVLEKQLGKDTPPKITKPGITPVKADPSRHSAFAQQILDMPVTPIEPVALVEGKDYQRGKLATGELVAVKNARNNLFYVTYEYNWGRRNDRLACFALETLKVSGAGKQSAQEVQRQLHELGLSVDTSCGRLTSTISISGIDRNFDQGMTLVRSWLADVAVDDGILKASVANALTQRANQKKNPQAIANAQAMFSRFGPDSDLLVVPSNKDLEGAKPATIKKILAGYLKMQHRTSYFGPRAVVGDKAQLAAITLGDGKTPVAPFPPMKFRAPNTTVLTDQTTAQTHVWMIWPQKPASEADRVAGTLFGEYIQPILYQEVRELRGLAYTVFGGFGPGARKADAASFFVYTGTQGDKTNDAVAAILETLARPIDEHRLGIAKETIAQNYRVYRVPPRAIPSVVYTWEDEGLKADPGEARTKAAMALDKAALEKWMKATLASPKIVSVVGDKQKLDAAKLKALAPVTEVPVEKLFGY